VLILKNKMRLHLRFVFPGLEPPAILAGIHNFKWQTVTRYYIDLQTGHSYISKARKKLYQNQIKVSVCITLHEASVWSGVSGWIKRYMTDTKGGEDT
jgi:hypothetical protein